MMDMFGNIGNVQSGDDREREAREWERKVQELEKQYEAELTAAADDEEKKNEIIKKIAEEVGMPPLLFHLDITGNPLKNQIYYYFMHVRKEPASARTVAEPWICKLCGTENTQNFCIGCGAVHP
jgi:hypothetical protein